MNGADDDDGLGEWSADSTPAATPAAHAPPAAPAALAGVDLSVGMPDAVGAVVRRRLQAIATEVLDELLDDAAIAQLRTAARDAATVALAEPAREPAPDPQPEPPELYFSTLPQFVEQLLVPMYRRSLGANTLTWCAEWWRHPEAIVRLEALWRSWEHLRLDPATGMSVWLRDHLDHHIAVLLSSDGPFKGCKPDQHGERLKPFPVAPPPAGLFDTA